MKPIEYKKGKSTIFNIDIVRYQKTDTLVLFVDFQEVFNKFKWDDNPLDPYSASKLDQIVYKAVISQDNYGGSCNRKMNIAVVDKGLPELDKTYVMYHEIGHLKHRNDSDEEFQDELIADVEAFALMKEDGILTNENAGKLINKFSKLESTVRRRHDYVRRVVIKNRLSLRAMRSQYFMIWKMAKKLASSPYSHDKTKVS